MSKYEIIDHPKIKHLNVFVNEIFQRGIHVHEDNEILLVLRGEGFVSIGSTQYFVSENDIILLNRADAHSIASKDGLTVAVIQISGSFLSKYVPSLKNVFFSSSVIRSGDLCSILRNIVVDIVRDFYLECDFFELFTVAHICNLYSLLVKNLPYTLLSNKEVSERLGGAVRITSVLSYLDENYRYSPRLFDIAQREGVTPTHLSHLFRDKLGISFQEHLGNLRFEHALRLIYDKRLSISELASESGFSDQKYMTKMFKKKLGVTPHEMRKSIKEKTSSASATDIKEYESRLSGAEVLSLIREYTE